MRTRPGLTVRQLLACFAVAVSSGCMPHVMHGPRVEDSGMSGSLSLTLGRNREFGDLSTQLAPSLYGGLRRSWVPDGGNGMAGSIGVQVPPLIAPFLIDEETGDALDVIGATSYLDVYIQPMRRAEPGSIDWGAGVLASTAIIGPYVQVGKMEADGDGWYATQLVAFSSGDDIAEGYYVMPAIVRREMDPGSTSAGNFSLALGFGFNENGGTDQLIMLGITIELGLGR